MKELRDIILLVCYSLIPITGFLCAAFLIYHQKEGWGWFLFVVASICLSIKMRADD